MMKRFSILLISAATGLWLALSACAWIGNLVEREDLIDTPTVEIRQASPMPTEAPQGRLIIPLNIDSAFFSPLSTVFDGENIWVGGRERDLAVKVSISDGSVQQVVQLAKMGVGVPDLAYDGRHVWALVGDSIIKFLASDGVIVGTYYFDFDSAGFTPESIVYDGTHFWLGGRKRDLVLHVSVHDGSILQIVQLAKLGVGVPDLAFDGENIWALVGDSVIKLNATDGTIIDTYYFDFDSAGFTPESIVYDGENMWVGGRDRDLAVKLSANDGSILHVTPLAKLGAGVPDLAFDGEHVWALVADMAIKLRSSDGVVVETYDAASGASSLVFDGASMWVADSQNGNLIRLP
jgi:hypothetical protein